MNTPTVKYVIFRVRRGKKILDDVILYNTKEAAEPRVKWLRYIYPGATVTVEPIK